MSVYIEVIALEHFSAPKHTEISGTTHARTRHAVFNLFMFNDRKQDSTITTSHRKHIIELLNQRNIMSNILSTIW